MLESHVLHENTKKNPRYVASSIGPLLDLFRSKKLPTLVLKGAQWLSGRVLDSRPRGCGFEPHWRHCVVVLKEDTFILA